ncbi:MAG: hypothetical protein IIV99_01455, partial [Oscillospiraceae bacterium]|nr:hypothetical protein [Oscillospiraceae bacterium]
DLARPTVTVSNVESTGKIKISWNAVEGASKYVLYRSETGEDNSWTAVNVSGTSITHSSAKAGTTYYYKVKAVHTNSAANSALSAVKSRMCDLARPTVAVKLNSNGKPVISWNAVEGASKYVLYRSTTGEDGSWTAVNVSKTYITHSSAVNGTKYYYKVKAVHTNSSANSALSTAKTITSK